MPALPRHRLVAARRVRCRATRQGARPTSCVHQRVIRAWIECSHWRRITDALISRVGPQGFEHSYPEELSGGMRQRAAARPGAGQRSTHTPDGRTLRRTRPPDASTDAETPPTDRQQRHKTVRFITHDVNAAIFLGDALQVTTARPGRIKNAVPVTIFRPRGRDTQTSEPSMALGREVPGLRHRDGDRRQGLTRAGQTRVALATQNRDLKERV